MKKLLMAAGVVALCGPLAANANYNLVIEDELRLFINSGECNVDASTPLFVTLDITTVPEGENAGERQLRLMLSGDDAETLDCFEFDAGAGSDPNVHMVTASDGSGGSISPSGEVFVYTNQRLSFDLIPASGMVVDSVTGTCGGTRSGNVYQTNPVTGACTVNVSFEEAPTITHSVTASAGTGGSISPSNHTVGQGGSASFTITPDEDYEVDSVSGCNGNLNGLTYTVSNVTSNCSVSVSFNFIGENAGNCGSESFNYNGNGTIDCRLWGNGWSSPIGTTTLEFGRDPLIMPFVATNNAGYNGYLTIVNAGSSGSRQMWISSSPGGAPLSQSFLGKPICFKEGAEFTLRWEQSNSTANVCSIQRNNTYFVNLAHDSCSSSSCASNWRHVTNGNP